MTQKGFAHVLLIIFLLAGLVAGVYLVQQTQIFKPKAAEPGSISKPEPAGNERIKFIGQGIECTGDSICTTSNYTFEVTLNLSKIWPTMEEHLEMVKTALGKVTCGPNLTGDTRPCGGERKVVMNPAEIVWVNNSWQNNPTDDPIRTAFGIWYYFRNKFKDNPQTSEGEILNDDKIINDKGRLWDVWNAISEEKYPDPPNNTLPSHTLPPYLYKGGLGYMDYLQKVKLALKNQTGKDEILRENEETWVTNRWTSNPAYSPARAAFGVWYYFRNIGENAVSDKAGFWDIWMKISEENYPKPTDSPDDRPLTSSVSKVAGYKYRFAAADSTVDPPIQAEKPAGSSFWDWKDISNGNEIKESVILQYQVEREYSVYVQFKLGENSISPVYYRKIKYQPPVPTPVPTLTPTPTPILAPKLIPELDSFNYECDPEKASVTVNWQLGGAENFLYGWDLGPVDQAAKRYDMATTKMQPTKEKLRTHYIKARQIYHAELTEADSENNKISKIFYLEVVCPKPTSTPTPRSD